MKLFNRKPDRRPRHYAAAIIVLGEQPLTIAELVARSLRAEGDADRRDREAAQRAVWGPPADWAVSA